MRKEILGYRIQELEGFEHVAYRLHGKRGAYYHLVRHINRPEIMYVVNRFGNIVSLKGNYSFTDRDGDLTCYYG